MLTEIPTFDYGLWVKAQTLATGQNVHEVAQILSNYKCGFDTAEFCGWNQNIINIVLRAEKKLRILLNNGFN